MIAALWALLAAAEGCPAELTDVAAAAQLSFVHDRGATPDHRLPETMGAGLAWLGGNRFVLTNGNAVMSMLLQQ